jgi:uncharacterized protein (TIGR00296 family)
MMDEKDGEFIVQTARRAISEYLKNGEIIKAPEDIKEELKEKRGVFVTLNTYPAKELRGCIGLPEPIKPLDEALVEAAVSSATRDPRFHPISLHELPHITVEVTVLTPPQPIEAGRPEERLGKIEIGQHGLIIEKGGCRGLLLPQVPVEHGWGKEEYLACLCMKAGLSVDAWREKDAKLYRFEGVVFSEVRPEGPVEKKEF